jgi:hypothetical protein
LLQNIDDFDAPIGLTAEQAGSSGLLASFWHCTSSTASAQQSQF